MSAYLLGYVLGFRFLPALVVRVGHIRAFSGMAALACVCTPLHGMVVNAAVWCLLRFVTGVCMMGLYLVIESWMNRVVSRENRGGVFAVYMTVVLLSLGTGQSLITLPVADQTGFLAMARTSPVATQFGPRTRIEAEDPAEVELAAGGSDSEGRIPNSGPRAASSSGLNLCASPPYCHYNQTGPRCTVPGHRS